MELPAALDFVRAHRQSVLTTLRRDGKPQLSNVLHTVDAGGVVRISVTADRAKYKNVTRNPWVALHVSREDFFAYAVLEGEVELSQIATLPNDAAADELVEHYRALMGEHDDWDEFRRTQVADRRVIIRLRPSRAYGMLPG